MTTASTTIVSPSTVTAMSLLASHAAMGNVSPLGYSSTAAAPGRLRRAPGSPALRGERHSVGFQHNFGGFARGHVELEIAANHAQQDAISVLLHAMPIAYWPGMVGVQVSSPVLGSMLNDGSAVMGLSQEKPAT